MKLFDFRDRIDTLVSTGPITGIEVEIYPKKDKNAQAVYLIIVITQFRIFQFIGGPSFQELFDTYKNGGILSYKELPYTSCMCGTTIHLNVDSSFLIKQNVLDSQAVNCTLIIQ